jgi:phenylpyruvate tautomerase
MQPMPLVNIYTSAAPPAPDAADALLKSVSSSVAALIGKPERYVMTCLVPQTRMTFAGTLDPACYVEVKSIGKMSPELTQRLSADLCEKLASGLGVQSSRTYLEFSDAQGYLWGYDGSTFG